MNKLTTNNKVTNSPNPGVPTTGKLQAGDWNEAVSVLNRAIPIDLTGENVQLTDFLELYYLDPSGNALGGDIVIQDDGAPVLGSRAIIRHDGSGAPEIVDQAGDPIPAGRLVFVGGSSLSNLISGETYLEIKVVEETQRIYMVQRMTGGSGGGAGDMLKAVYDTNDNGRVDLADGVFTQTPANAVVGFMGYDAGSNTMNFLLGGWAFTYDFGTQRGTWSIDAYATMFTDNSTPGEYVWSWSVGNASIRLLQNQSGPNGIVELDGILRMLDLRSSEVATPDTIGGSDRVMVVDETTGDVTVKTGAGSGGANFISQLGDVDLNGIEAGEIVIWNGSALVPASSFATDAPGLGAWFNWSNAQNVGVSLAFVDASVGTPVSWAWAMGDGNSYTTQNVNHAYANPGTYSVSLTITDANGATSNQVRQITIT